MSGGRGADGSSKGTALALPAEGWVQRCEPGAAKRNGFRTRLKKVAPNSVRLCSHSRASSGQRGGKGSGVVWALCWAEFCPSLLENHFLYSTLLSECKDEIVHISSTHGTARMRLRKRCGCTQSLSSLKFVCMRTTLKFVRVRSTCM